MAVSDSSLYRQSWLSSLERAFDEFLRLSPCLANCNLLGDSAFWLTCHRRRPHLNGQLRWASPVMVPLMVAPSWWPIHRWWLIDGAPLAVANWWWPIDGGSLMVANRWCHRWWRPSEPKRTPASPSEPQRTSANLSEPQQTPTNSSELQRTPASPSELQRSPANPSEPKREEGPLTDRKSKRSWWSHVSSAAQGPLHSILAQGPPTASGAQFCLLCCQPEPVPRSSTARVPQFTPWDPCRPLAWAG